MLYFCIWTNFSSSLFQELTSLDDIAGHLDFQNISRHDHCSVLIKVKLKKKHYSVTKEKCYFFYIQILPDFKDIFVSHVTWDDYSNLLKVLKRYTMPLKRTPATDSMSHQFQFSIIILFVGTLIPGFDMIFSSYPGTLHSTGLIFIEL